MITWPGAREYSATLQNPQSCFKSRKLRAARIKLGAKGEPFGASGQFAVVYKATLEDGTNRAIRVFTSERPEMTARYQAIGDYLKQSNGVRPLVSFDYDPKGIKAIDGLGRMKSYPLVTMEWVSGHELYAWVRTQCQQSNGRSIQSVAERWLNLVQDLGAAKIAHGDLQHANVMVVENGDLKLVDYDCMCVPALIGKPNLEIGVDPYQHPMRNEHTVLSPELDNFSAIFIFVVLRALAADTRLWSRFVEAYDYDKLLIRSEDFQSPNTSELYRALVNSPDSQVGRISKHLFELYRADIKDVPHLRDVLVTTDMVRTALSQRDFDLAVELVERIDNVPTDLKQPIQNARERVSRRKELERAVDSGNETSMQRLYDPRFFDDYPKAQSAAATAKDAAKVIPLLHELRSAQQQRRWREFERIWTAHSSLLASRKSASDFKVEADKSCERNRACDVVLQQARKPQPDITQLSEAWKRLKGLGGHPDIDSKGADIENLVQRELAWDKLRQFLSPPASEQADAGIANSWNEALFKGWQKANQPRTRLLEARERLNLIAKLRQLVSKPISITVERRICELSKRLPLGYRFALEQRIQTAAKRVETYDRLNDSLREPASDAQIVQNWSLLKQLQGAALVNKAQMDRLQLAELRMPIINNLRELKPSLRLDQLDKRILDIWREDILGNCLDAKPWRDKYLGASRRKELLAQLALAISNDDKSAITKICTEPYFAKYEFQPAWRKKIEDARKEIQQAEELSAALRDNDGNRFCELFDASCVRNHPHLFECSQDRICQLTRQSLLSRKTIGLNLPVGVRSIIREVNDRACFVRWSFPQSRFSDKCELTVSRTPPKVNSDLEQLVTVLRVPVTRALYEGAGGRRIRISPGWRGYYVAIWAKVDLGFCEFASEPLIVGQVGSDSSDNPIAQ